MAPEHSLLLALFATLGAILGSFIGVVAERAYTGQSFSHGHSRCNSCARTLGALDLVPVVSWLVFLGRCRTCRARLPGRYVVGELTLGVLFAASVHMLGLSLALPLLLTALVVLMFIVLYDLAHTIVPLPGLVALFLFSLAFSLVRAGAVSVFVPVLEVALVIGLGFYLLHVLSRGRAMGLADAPVAFSLSLLAGSMAFSGLLYSFWSGAAVGILILSLRRGGPRMGIEVPFVPFLAFGYLLAFFTQWNVLTLMLP